MTPLERLLLAEDAAAIGRRRLGVDWMRVGETATSPRLGAKGDFQAASSRSPLWVKRVGFVMSAVCPVYPRFCCKTPIEAICEP